MKKRYRVVKTFLNSVVSVVLSLLAALTIRIVRMVFTKFWNR